MSLGYRIQRKLLTILGDIRWFGWKNPFWFALNMPAYRIRGEHYREFKKVARPGDVLVRGFNSYVDGWFIGHWSHAAIYVGGEAEQVIHAMAEGVFIEDILNFMRTDRTAVLRPPADMVPAALERARGILGLEYDFDFNFSNHRAFSCTEVVDYCYPGLLTPSKYLWRTAIRPNDVAKCPSLVEVWNSEKPSGRIVRSTRKVRP